jgi:hypothetical protein
VRHHSARTVHLVVGVRATNRQAGYPVGRCMRRRLSFTSGQGAAVAEAPRITYLLAVILVDLQASCPLAAIACVNFGTGHVVPVKDTTSRQGKHPQPTLGGTARTRSLISLGEESFVINQIGRLRGGLAALVAVVGTLAVAAPAASANATGADSVACSFTAGTAGPLTYNGLTTGIPAGTVGGDGSFAFTTTTPATCVVVDVDGDATPGTYNVTIDSAGYFTNEVCGTGNVAGTAALWASTAGSGLGTTAAAAPSAGLPPTTPPTFYAPATGYTTADYGIDFQNGVGTLGGNALTPPDPAGHDAAIPDSANASGTVDITPQPANGQGQVGCVNHNATGFTVQGSFTATS